MAVIHWMTLKPSKLELLTTWLPTQPCYQGERTPLLAKAGGFRNSGVDDAAVADARGLSSSLDDQEGREQVLRSSLPWATARAP